MKVSSFIENLVPYVTGKPIGEVQREFGLERVCKLASNENPLGMSPLAQQAIQSHLKEGFRYPDGGFYNLKKGFSEFYGLSSNQISFGNGSNEVIDLLIRVYCNPGEKILIPQYSFVAYQICAQAHRVLTEIVPVNEKTFKVDLNLLLEKIKTDPEIRLVFLANPNNPTGQYFSDNELRTFLKEVSSFPVLVVVDEAYCEYVTAQDYPDTLRLMKEFSQLVVIRTLSKAYGLAGLRVGILLAQSPTLSYFDRVRNPFNVNEFAQVAALAALKDLDFIKKTQIVNKQGLEFLTRELSLLGFRVFPSQGNFLLVDFDFPIAQLNQRLLEKGVILRPLLGYGLQNHLRISVGLEEENAFAVSKIKEVLLEGSFRS